VGVVLVVAGLLGLVLLLLAVPVNVAFRLEGIEAFTGQVAVRWLFGLVRFRIPAPGAEKPPKRKTGAKAERKPAKARAKPESRGRGRKVLAVLRQEAFRRRVYRLARDLVRAAHLHQLRLQMRLGLGDPADTGRLWAVVGPLGAMAQGLRNADVRIEPDFVEPALEFQAHGRMVLVPLQFLALAVAFLLSPPSIRAWLALKGSHA
jgi:hypothetical protein